MHAYPDDLAALVRRQWNRKFQGESFLDLPVYERSDRLPRPAALEQLLSICYQASLLREEGRAVRFRLMLSEPRLPSVPEAGTSLAECLPFARTIPLSANDLRRLSAAAAFERSLIGVRIRADGRFEIWGLIHSGADWARALEGSRRSFQPLPPALVVSVTGPGNLSVAKGSLVVARLLGGRLVTPAPSVLEVASRDEEAGAIDALILAAHEREKGRSRGPWARIDLTFISQLRRQTALRLVSALRRLHHGGTLLILPRSLVRRPRQWQGLLAIKYPFPRGRPRRRLFTLLLRLLGALAGDAGRRFGVRHRVTWADYLSSVDVGVRRVDEAISEMVRFVADLSAVDGAVVMGQPLELLGFGAEISGHLAPVERVARALDASARRTDTESSLSVGTRHRSAYRICNAFPGLVAVVVSQDGSVRMMKRSGLRVIYSEHLGTGALDV